MNTSTKYTIQLSDIKNLHNRGELMSELDIVLQVWQDLNRLSATGTQSGQQLAPEDQLIKKILEQILIAKYGTIPEGYESVKQEVTEEEAKAMGIQLPDMSQAQAEVNERLGSNTFVNTMTVDEVSEKHKEDNPIYIAPANVGEREDRHL